MSLTQSQIYIADSNQKLDSNTNLLTQDNQLPASQSYLKKPKSFSNFILKSKLANFGLNPLEWHFFEVQPHCYLICHLTDSDYSYIGLANPKKSNWLKLELFSI